MYPLLYPDFYPLVDLLFYYFTVIILVSLPSDKTEITPFLPLTRNNFMRARPLYACTFRYPEDVP